MADNFFILILYAIPFIGYGALLLAKRMILRHKWKLASERSFSRSEKEYLEKNFRPYSFLTHEEKNRLELKIRYFLSEKRIEGVGGLSLNDNMKILIASHACLMLVNIETTEIFPGLKNIFITPSGYVEKNNPVHPYLGRPIHVPKAGEAWKFGPIILSWESIRENTQFPELKQNLIYHEFSHHLDQQDGHFDGTPKLTDQQQYKIWATVMSAEFKELRRLVYVQKNSDIDPYGATNEAEFFAVCTEYFFTDPVNLREYHPKVFELFKNYFKIDPRKWS